MICCIHHVNRTVHHHRVHSNFKCRMMTKIISNNVVLNVKINPKIKNHFVKDDDIWTIHLRTGSESPFLSIGTKSTAPINLTNNVSVTCCAILLTLSIMSEASVELPSISGEVGDVTESRLLMLSVGGHGEGEDAD